MMIEGMAAPASPCWPAGRLHRAFFGAGGCLQTWTARAGLRLIHHHQRSKGNAKDTKPRRVVSPARAKAKAARRVYVQFTISTISSAPRSLAALLLDSREKQPPGAQTGLASSRRQLRTRRTAAHRDKQKRARTVAEPFRDDVESAISLCFFASLSVGSSWFPVLAPRRDVAVGVLGSE